MKIFYGKGFDPFSTKGTQPLGCVQPGSDSAALSKELFSGSYYTFFAEEKQPLGCVQPGSDSAASSKVHWWYTL